jgi:hypothetical protein
VLLCLHCAPAAGVERAGLHNAIADPNFEGTIFAPTNWVSPWGNLVAHHPERSTVACNPQVLQQTCECISLLLLMHLNAG